MRPLYNLKSHTVPKSPRDSCSKNSDVHFYKVYVYTKHIHIYTYMCLYTCRYIQICTYIHISTYMLSMRYSQKSYMVCLIFLFLKIRTWGLTKFIELIKVPSMGLKYASHNWNYKNILLYNHLYISIATSVSVSQACRMPLLSWTLGCFPFLTQGAGEERLPFLTQPTEWPLWRERRLVPSGDSFNTRRNLILLSNVWKGEKALFFSYQVLDLNSFPTNPKGPGEASGPL